MNRVIVVGSPRVNGRSARLADELLYACIDECPHDGVSIVSVASTDVAPCTGCDACAQTLANPPASLAVEEGDPLEPHPLIAESDAALHQCVIDDDMAEVRKHLDAADELIVVSPVYFSGPPAQFKALLDRLQPYFRSDVRTRGKRPMILHVVGEGGDPHGYDALVGTVSSAFSVAGFRLESVFDWVGKIGEDGQILGDPEEYALAPEEAGANPPEEAGAESYGEAGAESPEEAGVETSERVDAESSESADAEPEEKPVERPRVRLSLQQDGKRSGAASPVEGPRGGDSRSGGRRSAGPLSAGGRNGGRRHGGAQAADRQAAGRSSGGAHSSARRASARQAPGRQSAGKQSADMRSGRKQGGRRQAGSSSNVRPHAKSAQHQQGKAGKRQSGARKGASKKGGRRG